MAVIQIIGAGFSGLSLAHELVKAGHKVEVFDRNDRTGGMIETRSLGAAFFERAAHSLSVTTELEELFSELSLEAMPANEAAAKRYFYRKDRLTRWPLSIAETMRMISLLVRSRFGSGFSPRHTETLHDWGERVLGPAGSRYLLETAMQGIYAGDGNTLSATLLLGHLFARKGSGDRSRQRIRGVVSFAGGMKDLVSGLEESLVARGVRMVLGKPIHFHDLPSGPKVIASSSVDASTLLEKVAPEVSDVLFQVPRSHLVSVSAHFKTPSKKGFGCLFPRGEGIRALGVLMNSAIFSRQWNLWSESWIYGGTMDPEIISLRDEEIVQQVLTDRQSAFRLTEKPVEYSVTTWPDGLPEYSVQLEKILQKLQPRLDRMAEAKQIWLHGNYLGGIGLSRIYSRSRRLAQEITQKVGGHP